jgi:hypothetical protein
MLVFELRTLWLARQALYHLSQTSSHSLLLFFFALVDFLGFMFLPWTGLGP